MEQVSKKQSDATLHDVVHSMEKIDSIIIERVMGKQCPCYNRIYNTGDPDCQSCNGTGIIMKRIQRLSEASLESSSRLHEMGDPLVYACSTDYNIELHDIIIHRGSRYVVIEKSAGFTVTKKEIIIYGLDYERNYDHSETDLRRYK